MWSQFYAVLRAKKLQREIGKTRRTFAIERIAQDASCFLLH
jgi:hypothetical protein